MDGKYSDWEEVLSSVVQGSVLGRTLFDIYIDNIDMVILLALIWKFADDAKVAKIIESAQDGREMQKIIDDLAEWAESGKCASMSESVKCFTWEIGILDTNTR